MNELYSRLKVGDKVGVKFHGGIEGSTTGEVLRIIPDSTDFEIKVLEKFWNSLSRSYYYVEDKVIVHAKELVEILPPET